MVKTIFCFIAIMAAVIYSHNTGPSHFPNTGAYQNINCIPPTIAKAILVCYIGRDTTINMIATDEDSIINIDALPGGIVLDSLTGEIHGVPTDTGIYTIRLFAKACENDTDTCFITVNWDTLHYDSIADNRDSLYTLDTGWVYGYFPGINSVTLKIWDSTATVVSYTSSLLKYLTPADIAAGKYPIILDDGVAPDTSDDSVYYYGDYYDTSTITLDPRDTTITNGGNARFAVAATSTGTITYQWQRYHSGSWGNEDGATNDTLIFATTLDMDGDSLRCIATDARGADTSTAALLHVYPQYTLDTNLVLGIDAEGSIVVKPVGLTYDSAAACTTIAPVSIGNTCDSIITWIGAVRTKSTADTVIHAALSANVIDSVFYSDNPTPQYTATVTISGGGHVDASPGLTVDSGLTITLTATPGADSVFVGWSGDYSGTDNPAVFTMTMDTATTATFEYSPSKPSSALSRWAPWIRSWRRVWR